MKFEIQVDKNKSIKYGDSNINDGYHIYLKYSGDGSQYLNLPPILKFYYRVYMASPQMNSVSSTFFIKLFQPDLWGIILVLYITILMFLIFYIHSHRLKINQYIESAFHVIGISSEQINFSTISLSFCVIIYTILFFMLEQYFTTFLTTKLAITDSFPLEKLEDFTLQLKYKICIGPPFKKAHKILSSDKIYEQILNTQECDNIKKSMNNGTGDLTLKILCDEPHITVLMPDFYFQRIWKPYRK